MAELDTIVVFNPLKERFEARFNGELYGIDGRSSKSFAQFVGFHVAKHLSDHILGAEVLRLKKSSGENVFNPKIGQLTMHDNVERRVVLYDILKSKDLVERCIAAYPFKGFIGDMKLYDKHVEMAEAPKETKKKADDETTE